MIFVMIGTHSPFDRLVGSIGGLGADEEIVVQCGSGNVRPANARCVDFLPFDQLTAMIDEARVVITHAGAGSILTTLGRGKHPIAVPRLRRLGEAVDDHQVEFARALAEVNLLTLVEDLADLGAAVASAPESTERRTGDGRLAHELRNYFQTLLNPLDVPA